nr:uncharacterized protein LOC123494780 isoform X2 [Aegilops tauschii subsp. strangulata]
MGQSQFLSDKGIAEFFISDTASAHTEIGRNSTPPPLLATPLRSLGPHLRTASDGKGKNEERDEHYAGMAKRYKARSWRWLHQATMKPTRRMRPPTMDGPRARKRTRSPRLTGTAHMLVSGMLFLTAHPTHGWMLKLCRRCFPYACVVSVSAVGSAWI